MKYFILSAAGFLMACDSKSDSYNDHNYAGAPLTDYVCEVNQSDMGEYILDQVYETPLEMAKDELENCPSAADDFNNWKRELNLHMKRWYSKFAEQVQSCCSIGEEYQNESDARVGCIADAQTQIAYEVDQRDGASIALLNDFQCP